MHKLVADETCVKSYIFTHQTQLEDHNVDGNTANEELFMDGIECSSAAAELVDMYYFCTHCSYHGMVTGTPSG